MEVIPTRIRRIWNADELRVLLLLSLVIQIFLIFLAMLRKRSASRTLSAVLWSFYLSADYVATLALGNLLNNLNGDNNSGAYNGDGDLLAFWAPFLLLHLGGPDTITAYSIEDNELWWRHLLGLVFQVAAAIVVFLLSLPSTRLWKAAVPVYVAGIVKYAERTLALRSASMDHLMGSMTTDPDPGPSYAKFMEEYASQRQAGLNAYIHKEPEPPTKLIVSDPEAQKITGAEIDAENMSKAYNFFKTFKRLIVDLILSFHDRAANQSFFLQCKSPRAFKVIEIELSFMFDLLYTKGALLHSFPGLLGRFLSFGMIILSLIFFCNVKRGNYYKEADVIVTYILLVVALWLEAISVFLLISSDWAFISLKAHGLFRPVFTIVSWLKLPIKSRWSNCMSQNNLISFCRRDESTRFCKILCKLNLKETWDNLVCTSRITVSDRVKELIFDELKEKAQNNGKDTAGYKRFNTCRGEWVLQLKGYRTTLGWSIDGVEFDESILLWHIATDLCYYTDTEKGAEGRNKLPDMDLFNKLCQFISRRNDHREEELSADYREISRELSNYMLYLLLQRPFMLTAGIGKIRFGDTCAEAKKFFQQEEFTLDKQQELTMDKGKAKDISKEERKMKELKWACDLLLEVETDVPPKEVKGDRSKSVLFDACKLAKDLLKVPAEKRWLVMSAVWAEMLCFAASHCRGNAHARQLSTGGGEFLTHVWFLIAHMGMGEHYRIEAGHARAKLIVEK